MDDKVYERMAWVIVAMSALAYLVNLLISIPGLRTEAAAAWVQAVGSIGAILATIFVMRRQNENSLHLLIEQEQRSLRRRALAVKGIVDRVSAQVTAVCNLAENAPDVGAMLERTANQSIFEEAKRVVAAIPAHDLGSYDMAVAVQMLLEAIGQLLDAARRTVYINNEQALEQVRLVKLKVQVTEETFQKGYDTLFPFL